MIVNEAFTLIVIPRGILLEKWARVTSSTKICAQVVISDPKRCVHMIQFCISIFQEQNLTPKGDQEEVVN